MATINKFGFNKYQVTLNEQEFSLGRATGITRFNDSRDLGLKSGDCLASAELDIQGCLSEIAVAKLLGINDFSPTQQSFKGADIPCHALDLPKNVGIQVRGSKLENGGLIVRQNDSKNDIYILVTGEDRNYVVHGWSVYDDVIQQGREYLGQGRKKSCWILAQHKVCDLRLIPGFSPKL